MPVAVSEVEPLALPVALVLPEPVTVPELAPVESRPRSRGAFASVEVERRDSVVVRPLARGRDFIVPCLLQSHLQSLSMEPDDATSRLVVDDELEVEPRSEVLLSVEVPAFGIA